MRSEVGGVGVPFESARLDISGTAVETGDRRIFLIDHARKRVHITNAGNRREKGVRGVVRRDHKWIPWNSLRVRHIVSCPDTSYGLFGYFKIVELLPLSSGKRITLR